MGAQPGDESLGERIRRLREALGWRREDLASRSGLSHSAIEQLEMGKRTDPRASTLGRLADVLGIGLDELVGRGESRKAHERGPKARFSAA